MKKTFIAAGAVLTAAAALLLLRNKKKSGPETVSFVDLNRYLGTWYEIAKIPNSFQKDCEKNTTANYSLNEDGTIKVVNKCVEKNGQVNEAEGKAVVDDPKTNAKLKVSFISILGVSIFQGDYWVIGLDEDYNWAIVGHPERKYGWILCRNKKMSEDEHRIIYSIIRRQGYNPDDFAMTLQE